MDAKPRLLDQVRDKLRTLHYSYRTEQQYLFWARRYILFHHKRHPSELGGPEVEDFLTHLAVDRHVSASTQNQALAAILFLYRKVLEIELPWFDGGGLRVTEALQLRVKDLQFDYRQIIVRSGKGRKDRVTIMPDSKVEPLQKHLVGVRVRHEHALRRGYAGVEMPYALERKAPAPHLPRHRAGTTRAQGCEDDADLYACHAQGRECGAESVGSVSANATLSNPGSLGSWSSSRTPKQRARLRGPFDAGWGTRIRT